MKALRLAAVLSTAIYLLIGLIGSFQFQGAQWPSLLLGPAVVVVGYILLIWVARGSLGSVLIHRDLLVPIGLFAPLQSLFAWMTTWSALSALYKPLFQFSWLHVASIISAATLLQFFVNTLFIGWIVSLLLQILHEQPVDLLQPFRVIGSWFWRVAIVRALGSLAVYIFLALGIKILSLSFHLGIWAGGILTVVILLPAMIAFNAVFGFVVPAALRRPGFILKAWAAALGFGLRSWRRTFVPLLALSVLVGSIPLVTLSLTQGHQSFNVKFNLYWLADFLPGSGVWLNFWSEKAGVAPVVLISQLVHLFLVFASVVFFLEIYRRAGLRSWLSGSSADEAIKTPPPTA